MRWLDGLCFPHICEATQAFPNSNVFIAEACPVLVQVLGDEHPRSLLAMLLVQLYPLDAEVCSNRCGRHPRSPLAMVLVQFDHSVLKCVQHVRAIGSRADVTGQTSTQCSPIQQTPQSLHDCCATGSICLIFDRQSPTAQSAVSPRNIEDLIEPQNSHCEGSSRLARLIQLRLRHSVSQVPHLLDPTL